MRCAERLDRAGPMVRAGNNTHARALCTARPTTSAREQVNRANHEATSALTALSLTGRMPSFGYASDAGRARFAARESPNT